MNQKHLSKLFLLGLMFALPFAMVSCGQVTEEKVTVMLESGDYSCPNPLLTGNKGTDFVFTLYVAKDKAVNGCSYDNYSVVEANYEQNNCYHLTFHEVNYSTVVTLDIKEIQNVVYQSDETGSESKTVRQNLTHLRYNTSNDYHFFHKENYSLLGYTCNETYVGLGSRIDISQDNRLIACWAKQNDISEFSYVFLDSQQAAINGFSGTGKDLVIPDRIEGRIVTQINSYAFQNQTFERVVLPYTLLNIQENGFQNCIIENLYFYDRLTTVSDTSFSLTSIHRAYLNAVQEPVYSGTYFDTYTDKVDRLISLKNKKKIILYSGSSTRFGYQSQLIDAAYKNYDVVNMGVYAYTASLPQIDILSNFVGQGDILITSPEFDTIETQISLSWKMDYALFCMCESNYNLLSLLDLTQYTGFFDAFALYQHNRKYMEAKDYDISPNSFDEDGNATSSSTYNIYGDYALYRKNNEERKSFGIRRAFYHKKYFSDTAIQSFIDGYQLLKDKGVTLYYTYSPRMNISLSDDSDNESIQELGAYLEANIPMTFLNTIQDSLIDPLYFFGTDNHLSTEGAKARTESLLQSLKAYLPNL